VALVTGAASTLGSAISLKMAEQGMRIALHYGKSLKKTRQLQKLLTSLGTETILIKADLSKPPQIHSVVRQLVRQWGRLDVLVNNASVFKPTPLVEENWPEWEKVMKVNSISPCLLAASAKPHLQRSKGCIVNITDIYGEMPALKNHGAYSASKAALLFLTKYLAVEWAPDIRVNAVSPGVISFPGNYSISQRRRLIQKTALKREGKPEEIAEAVWFLASNRFITGQILKVDGGRFIS
jgi:pteridine reductase